MHSNIYFTDIKSHILSHIRSTETSVKLAVSWLTDREIFALLLDKLSNGIAVSLVTRNDYFNNHPQSLPWNDFIIAGGNLRFSRNGEQLHYKFILADDTAVLCTSYNLTCFANGNNRENVMTFSEPAFVNQFVVEHAYLCSTLPLQTHVTPMQWAEVPEDLHGFYKGTLENDARKQNPDF